MMQSVTDNFIHGFAAVSDHKESEGVLGSDGMRISEVSYVKRYMHKKLHGVGEVRVQYRYLGNEKIDFVGFEIFSGAIGGRRGSVVFDLSGTVNAENGLVTVQQTLNSDSGSAELLGCSAKGSYVIAKDGHCSFELTMLT